MGLPLPNHDSEGDRFKPYQILCLEHQDSRLYAEVVQFVELRGAYWVHPLALLMRAPASEVSFAEFGLEQVAGCFQLHDLRQGADLVWPACLFRAALDTEVMPLLSHLSELATFPDDKTNQKKLAAHHQLQQFVQQVWQAYTHLFPA
jgi:hypothetical protein